MALLGRPSGSPRVRLDKLIFSFYIVPLVLRLKLKLGLFVNVHFEELARPRHISDKNSTWLVLRTYVCLGVTVICIRMNFPAAYVYTTFDL